MFAAVAATASENVFFLIECCTSTCCSDRMLYEWARAERGGESQNENTRLGTYYCTVLTDLDFPFFF